MPSRSAADLLAMADRQSAAFFRAAATRPWATVHLDDDVIHGTSGIPLAAFNGATGARFSRASADERIEAVLRPFRDGAIDMTWWVGPTSTPADLVERLAAHGLTVDDGVPVMALDLEGWTPPPPVPGLVTEPVTDPAAFHEAMEVLFAGFEMPAAVLPLLEERYIDYAVGPDAIQRVQVTRLEGRPIATSLGFIVDGVVGIYNVATMPDARRLGAGTAATVAALVDAAARGATHAILESSALGRSVYERLGFREIGSVTILLGAFGSMVSGAAA
jgi:GNAT superfamily N-acetyltransferase